MRITNIDLKPNTNNSSMAKAWGKVVFDNVLSINISIMDKGQGPWVAFPGRKDKNGKYINEVYLDTKESNDGKSLAQEIIDTYQAIKNDGGGNSYQNNNYSNNMNSQSSFTSDDIPF